MKKKAISGGRRAYILTMRILMGAAVVITAALVLFLIAYVLIKGLPNVSWTLLSTAPSYLSDRIGILPDILNTISSSPRCSLSCRSAWARPST